MSRPASGSLIDLKVRRDLWSIRGRLIGLALIISSGVAILYGITSAQADLHDTQQGVLRQMHAADLEVQLTAQSTADLPDLNAVPGVAVAEPRLVLPASVALPDSQALSSVVVVQPSSTPQLNQLRMLSGRPARPGSQEVVIDRALSSYHGYQVGESISLTAAGQQQTWQVAGIALSSEFLVTTTNPDYVIPTPGSLGVLWADPTLLNEPQNPPSITNSVLLSYNADADADATQQAVLRALDTAPVPARITDVVPQRDSYSASSIRLDLDAFGAYSPAIVITLVALSLLLGVLTFHRFILEQRIQLGMLTALGYPRARIRRALLRAGLAVGLVGALIGLLLGWAVGRAFATVYADSMNLPFVQHSLHWNWAALALTIGVAGGGLMLLAASAPALSTSTRELLVPPAATAAATRRAPRQRPSPLPVAVRYALRGLRREGLLTATGVLAMSASIAVAVSYGLGVSSTFGTVDDAFGQERWQYAVDLTAPTPLTAATQQLRSVPAVTDLEPYVRTAGTLTAGTRQASSVLVGVPAPSRMHVVGPSQGREVRRDDEAVLSTDLARDLNVGIGDQLRLTKADQQLPVTVVGLTDDMFLRTANLTLAAAQELSAAPGAVTGFYLQGDTRIPELLPVGANGIAVITDKNSLVTHFGQQMAETMGIVYIAIGFSVAVSILFVTTLVYLSVAERRDEFAVLLSLGFSTRRLRTVILISVVGQVLTALALSVPLALLLALYLNARMGQAWFAVDLHPSWTAFLWPMLAALAVAPVVGVLGSRATARMSVTQHLRARAA